MVLALIISFDHVRYLMHAAGVLRESIGCRVVVEIALAPDLLVHSEDTAEAMMSLPFQWTVMTSKSEKPVYHSKKACDADALAAVSRLELAGSVKLEDPQQQKRKDEIYDAQKMAWEVREMKSVVESMDCPIVLSHLDLLANNIFVPAESKVCC